MFAQLAPTHNKFLAEHGDFFLRKYSILWRAYKKVKTRILAEPPASPPGVHKTGIRGIRDTRQIVDGKTNDIENNDKKGGFQTRNIRQLMKKEI